MTGFAYPLLPLSMERINTDTLTSKYYHSLDQDTLSKILCLHLMPVQHTLHKLWLIWFSPCLTALSSKISSLHVPLIQALFCLRECFKQTLLRYICSTTTFLLLLELSCFIKCMAAANIAPGHWPWLLLYSLLEAFAWANHQTFHSTAGVSSHLSSINRQTAKWQKCWLRRVCGLFHFISPVSFTRSIPAQRGWSHRISSTQFASFLTISATTYSNHKDCSLGLGTGLKRIPTHHSCLTQGGDDYSC